MVENCRRKMSINRVNVELLKGQIEMYQKMKFPAISKWE